MSLLDSCYESCDEYNLLALATLKRYSGDTVMALGQAEGPLAMKVARTLQEDAATLRRIRRLGPWEDRDGKERFPNGKALIMSGMAKP